MAMLPPPNEIRMRTFSYPKHSRFIASFCFPPEAFAAFSGNH
jgi:hypothetical protein